MSELDELRDPCSTCGADVDIACARWCPCGMDGDDANAIGRSLVALGHSIARFARAAEVEELVETVQDEARNYADAFAGRLPLTRREAWERHTSALSRLAALAKGGAL